MKDEFINFTHKLAKCKGVRIPSFGHTRYGNLHVYICKDEQFSQSAWGKVLNDCFDEMYSKAEGKVS